MNSALLTRPSALVPVAMSLGALATVLIYAAMFGTARQADEGTAAHLWQLLMAGQLPVVAFFAFKWLPSSLDRQGRFLRCSSVRRSPRCSRSGGSSGRARSRGSLKPDATGPVRVTGPVRALHSRRAAICNRSSARRSRKPFRPLDSTSHRLRSFPLREIPDHRPLSLNRHAQALRSIRRGVTTMDPEIQRLLSRTDDLLHRSRTLAKELEVFSESLHSMLMRHAERQHRLEDSESRHFIDLARRPHSPWR